jgi:hypothetical protein
MQYPGIGSTSGDIWKNSTSRRRPCLDRIVGFAAAAVNPLAIPAGLSRNGMMFAY